MLAVKKYDPEYIDYCRSQIEEDVNAYDSLPEGVKNLAAIEANYFNNLLLALDRYFVHRMRGVETKNANPLNELRILCNGIVHNKGIMFADKSIKYDLMTSLSKFKYDDEIRMTRESFVTLSSAFFKELEHRFL